MGAQDHAILVGISRYSDSSFAPLNGPPNDVERMHSWLVSASGGAVPPENIVKITSPPKDPENIDPEDWEPTEQNFQRAYRRVVTNRETGELIKREGRFYLYFSGHGFSERRDQATRAAVFAANATRNFANNICGTIFALAAREQALFKEIVLIMDCCRDAELNLPFSTPALNTGTSDAAPAVRFMAIYAAPKGGKAQERPFAELNGMTCGLLTHALLKSLKEAPPDSATGVSSAALKKYLFSKWAEICGTEPAPEPEFVSPTGAEIQFPLSTTGIEQGFTLKAAPTQSVEVEVLTPNRESVARQIVTPNQSLRFMIKLQAGLYRYKVTGDLKAEGVFEASEVHDVVL
jgi:hypothetical protein